ncbi:hypothetical protein BsWGS_22306 [Bradybaena similaris]
MDSHNFLPSHNIKLEPACETGHVHSFAKEVTTEVKVFDMVDSKLPVNIKIDQTHVDVDYPGQDKKTPACSQIVPSLPMQEHSQMEMIMYGNMDCMFVKQELSDVLCEDKIQRFGKMEVMMNCSSDLKMNGHNNTESTIIQNSHEALREHENLSHISENVSSMFGVNTKDSLTDKNCQLQTNFGKKIINKAYISDICNSTASTVSILNRQEREYTEEKSHKCDCHSPDAQADQLKTHRRTHPGERPYKCDASFTQAGSLKRHTVTHTGERHYKCDSCGASFTEAGSLKKHKRTHTGERPYKCDACGASFTRADTLKKHKRTHTGERPYKCDACGASFTEAGNLKRHMVTHTGERHYKCDSCDASFTEAGSLKKHKRTHTGERPYKCDSCDASFTEAGSLKKHKRTHTGERPYKCDACGASFTDVSYLNIHKRTHTGERPYKCDACDASFTQACHLKKHKKTHTHRIETLQV